MGCDRKDVFYIHSKVSENTISVITDGDIRYIVNGKHEVVPKRGYVKLNVKDIDPLGDAIQVCWNENGYTWKVINNKSKILEVKLDSSKFYFSNRLPRDARGIPTQISYVKHNCAVFDFLRRDLIFKEGGTLEMGEK